MPKIKRKAVRNIFTGKVDHFTGSKTVGIRNPITGKIEKREKKKKPTEIEKYFKKTERSMKKAFH